LKVSRFSIGWFVLAARNVRTHQLNTSSVCCTEPL